jgi:hypothetical protein
MLLTGTARNLRQKLQMTLHLAGHATPSDCPCSFLCIQNKTTGMCMLIVSPPALSLPIDCGTKFCKYNILLHNTRKRERRGRLIVPGFRCQQLQSHPATNSVHCGAKPWIGGLRAPVTFILDARVDILISQRMAEPGKRYVRNRTLGHRHKQKKT